MSCSGPLDGAVVENVHAGVRTKEGFEGRDGRSEDEAFEKRQRIGRLDAIVAVDLGDYVRLRRDRKSVV